MDRSTTPRMSRRQFMAATIYAIGGLIGVTVGIPAVEYIAGPSLTKVAQNWVKLGAIGKIENSTPTLFKATVNDQTGWINNQEEISVYVITEDGQTYSALSNVCTHLGCHVRWNPDDSQFACPCHNGVFAKDGSVVSGPPPRPLDHYQTKVENGDLYILRG
jgi:menaquinol-cytochrome c reductase iron-sulfur subunit